MAEPKPKEKEKELSPEDALCQTVTRMEPQFKMALPPQIPSPRFTRVAVTAIRNDAKLAAPNIIKQQLFSAFMRCAQDGLLPDGREAAIVPWGSGGQVRYMPMVAGIMKKARNSGEIKTINAKVVYEKDTYESWTDETGEHFKHAPARGDRGGIILTYAYAATKDGGFYFEEVLEADMQKIKAMSRASDSPWKGPFEDEMRRKSALRRLAKYRLPSSSDLDSLIQSEDDLHDLDNGKPEPKPAEPRSSRLNDIVDRASAQEAETVPATDAAPSGTQEEPPI